MKIQDDLIINLAGAYEGYEYPRWDVVENHYGDDYVMEVKSEYDEQNIEERCARCGESDMIVGSYSTEAEANLVLNPEPVIKLSDLPQLLNFVMGEVEAKYDAEEFGAVTGRLDEIVQGFLNSYHDNGGDDETTSSN